jgi:hypothetical protein
VGSDLIGWRSCELQARLGDRGFLAKLKLRAYQRAVEERVPPGQRDAVKIQLVVHRPEGPVQRAMSYPEIRAEAAEFASGIPACASCPLGGGAPLGCYRYVTYPIDEATERALFELFQAEVGTEGSVAQRFHAARLSRLPSSGMGWHVRRGSDPETGGLAMMPAPLVHTWGGWFSKKRLDSAQILFSLVSPERDAASLALHAEMIARVAAYARERSLRAPAGPARGLDELASLAPFFAALAEGAKRERWSIVVDA